MNIEEYFLIEKISDNEHIIYNSIKHIPLKVSNDGLDFFETILKSKTKEDLADSFEGEKKKEFNSFLRQLKKVNFLSLEDDVINYDYITRNYNDTRKTFYFHLTNKCNLKCKYCYNEAQRKDLNELSLNEWKQIVDKILPITQSIILTGGEATLYPYLSELVEYIKSSKKIHLELFSNASIDFEKKGFSEMLKKIDNINFSCDNIENDNHERIGFNRDIFLKNISFLKKLGIDNRLSLGSVLQKGKVNDVLKVKEFCAKNDLGSRVSLFIPNIQEELSKMPLLEEFISFSLPPQVAEGKGDVSLTYKTITCGAASNTFSIDALGNVFPCQSFHFPEFKLGNILHEEFKEIFNSPIATMLRATNNINYKKGCKDCNIKYICAGGCIANTYGLEKGLLEFPKTLCSFYRASSISRLKKVEF